MVLTWERDAAGHSIGMAPSAIPFHLALPLMLGVVVSLSGTRAPGARAGRCALAGVVFGFVEFGILALVDLLWLPAVEAGPPFWESAATLVGAIAYAGVCAALGILGGVLATAWTALIHHDGGGTDRPHPPAATDGPDRPFPVLSRARQGETRCVRHVSVVRRS